MKTYAFFLISLCSLSSILFPSVNPSLSIDHTIVPILERIEVTPPEKYSERSKREIKALLERKDQKIRIITYNILFDLFDHQLKDPMHSWPERLPKVVASIENMRPDILCVQEMYPDQFQNLKEALGASFASFVGTSTTGELNAIFYRKKRFELDTKKFQVDGRDRSSASLKLPLNDQDDSPIAKIPHFLPSELEPGRQLTLAHFKDKLTNKGFAVINTHLTYYRINSREDQADFIENLVQDLQALNKPVIFTGDCNTFPNHPDRAALPFYDGDQICRIFQKRLKDAREVALLGHIGPTSTGIRDFFTRGDRPLLRKEDSDVILDHIYVSPEIAVIAHATEPGQVNGQFPSDHLPVIADIVLP